MGAGLAGPPETADASPNIPRILGTQAEDNADSLPTLPPTRGTFYFLHCYIEICAKDGREYS